MTTTVERSLDGRTNMERDARLFARAEQGGAFARVYSWDGPWVSLGRFQTAERALKDASLVPWVIRPTGGKAVLHGHDVTVGLAANLEWLGLKEHDARRVSKVYRLVVGRLAEALTAAGIPATLAESTPFVRSAGRTADCFAHVSPNDVVDPATGAKVCGCALRVSQDAVLLQASVPVSAPLIDPALVFTAPHVPSRPREISPEDLAECLSAVRFSDLAIK